MKEKYSDEELVQLIELEGFGYAVRDYLDAEAIEDPDTADLWRAAQKALNDLALHLGLDY